jgi:tetratricopeptide (TPR) repeat protein
MRGARKQAEVLCSSLLLLSVLFTGPARAAEPRTQPPDERTIAAASALWSEGYKLFHQKRFGEALARFEAADALLPAKAEIRYYLGRTHAALGQCADALETLGPLAGTLGDSEAARDAERLRAGDEASCRVSLAAEHMEVFRCTDAATALATLRAEALPAERRPMAVALVSETSRCTAAFDTSGPDGRAAAAEHAESRKHLAAGRPIDALRLADESLAQQASEPAKLARALALEQLGRCDDALVALDNAKRSIDSTEQAEQAGVIDRCRLAEAQRLASAQDCRAAVPLMEKLHGRVEARNQQWLDETLAWCSARTTPFLTDTPDRRASYALFQAAREAAKAGRLDSAVDRYRKALGLADEPIIRRELAGLLLRLLDCPATERALTGIPAGSRTPRDIAALQACGPWRPQRQLDSRGLVGYVDAVEQAWLRMDAQDLEAARKLLGVLYVMGANPAVRAVSLDVLFQMSRCTQYVAETSDAPRDVRDLVTDIDSRRATCAADAPAVGSVNATPPTPATGAEFGLQAVSQPRQVRRGARVAGWTLLTLGIGGLGVGAYSMARGNKAATRASEAASVYDDDAASALNARQAWDEYNSSTADSETWRTRTWIFGVAGSAVALTGMILVIVGRNRGETQTVRLEPFISGRTLGLAGSY